MGKGEADQFIMILRVTLSKMNIRRKKKKRDPPVKELKDDFNKVNKILP